MKKGISVLIAGILMISLTACQGDVREKITRRYRNMESYTGVAVVTVTGNKGPAVYEIKQSYQKPDSYRLEVLKPEQLSGTVSVRKGDILWLKRGDTKAVPVELTGLEEEMDLFFPVEFLEYVLSTESGSELTENQDGTVLLAAPMKEPSRYRFSRKLLLEKKSLLPKIMTVYHQDGSEVFRVEFRDFETNVPLDEEIFQ